MNKAVQALVKETGYRERAFLVAWLCDNMHLLQVHYNPQTDRVAINGIRNVAAEVKVRWEGSDSLKVISDFLDGKGVQDAK